MCNQCTERARQLIQIATIMDQAAGWLHEKASMATRNGLVYGAEQLRDLADEIDTTGEASRVRTSDLKRKI